MRLPGLHPRYLLYRLPYCLYPRPPQVVEGLQCGAQAFPVPPRYWDNFKNILLGRRAAPASGTLQVRPGRC